MKLTAQQAAAFGFIFPGHRGWITPETHSRIAIDAALVTMPNSAVPADLLAYIDPEVIDILTAPLMAREIYNEVRKGTWTTSFARFRINEVTGKTGPYSDKGKGPTSGSNNNWVVRENYLFETVIEIGDLEADISAEAKINLMADKQKAAARVLDIDANKFYLRGVAGKRIYGALNDPSLPAPIAPQPTGTSNSILWANKTTKQRYEDILFLFQNLVTATKGLVSKDSPLKLVMSPQLAVDLASATDFNVSVQDMLDKYFRKLEIVTVPELYDASTGETMQLIATEVLGQRTGELAYSEKVRTFPPVRGLSGMEQKWCAGTEGAIIRRPVAIQQMRGM